MARIFITGSADGLGFLAGKQLQQQGHSVLFHARNEQRALDLKKKLDGNSEIVVGDLSDQSATKALAHDLSSRGVFDAVIHNAGIYTGASKDIFTVNTLAPYILTALMPLPKRLIYLTSGLHSSGRPVLDQFTSKAPSISYSDSKLHVMMLAFAIARQRLDVLSNAVNPGWVPTKMGGAGAPDDLHEGYQTQVWLATGNDPDAKVTGRYFFHQKERGPNPYANDTTLQDAFLERCQAATGVVFTHF